MELIIFIYFLLIAANVALLTTPIAAEAAVAAARAVAAVAIAMLVATEAAEVAAVADDAAEVAVSAATVAAFRAVAKSGVVETAESSARNNYGISFSGSAVVSIFFLTNEDYTSDKEDCGKMHFYKAF